MAAVQETSTSQSIPFRSMTSEAHPLNPLSASEISVSAELIKSVWPAHTDLRFKAITLEEPPKRDLVPYLEAEHHGVSLPPIPRKSFVAYYIRNTVSQPRA